MTDCKRNGNNRPNGRAAAAADVRSASLEEGENTGSTWLNHQHRYLLEAIKDLASARELEQVQRIVARAARKLIGADGATIVLRDKDLCYYADEDAIAPLWKGKRFPLTLCISGWVMMHKTPAVIPDIYADDRIPAEAYRPTFVKSLAMVPVNTREPVAAIGNYWQTSHVPSATELQLLQTLADAAARVIENVSLLNELERRVIKRTEELRALTTEFSLLEEKKDREMTRALHDELGPILALAKQRLGRLEKMAGDPLAQSECREISALLAMGIEFTRTLTFNFSPPLLDGLPFKESLYWLVNHFLEKNGIRGRVVESGEPCPLPDKVRMTLFNCTRELFVNSVKHAQAGRVDIKLIWQQGQRLELEIQDDGVGFDVREQREQAMEKCAYGLVGIRERLTYVQGTFQLSSAAGQGTRAVISIPCQ